jgi:galactokinase
MVSALKQQDMGRAGELLNASHSSLRDDFEVSTREVDRLVALAQDYRGVHGARLTGAGFGGSIVVLLSKQAAEGFAVDVVERFSNEAALPARAFECGPSAGLEVLDWPTHA